MYVSRPSITLKRGSANSFFSAARFTLCSTFAPMKALKSASQVRLSSGGSSTGGSTLSFTGTGAAAASFFSRDQRRRKSCFSSLIARSTPRPVLGRKERLRPDALLRLAPVVFFDELADPGEQRRGHPDRIDVLAAVHPAARLVVAQRRELRHGALARRHRAVAFHPPQDEDPRFLRGDIVVVALGLGEAQHDLEARIEPLLNVRSLDQDAR